MKNPLVIAAVAALLLGAGYFVVLPKMNGAPSQPVEAEEEEVDATAADKKSSEPGLIFPTSERVLNVATSGGVPHYARIELALEFAKPKLAKESKAGKEKKSEGEAKDAAPPLDPALEPVAERQVLIDDLIVRVVGEKTVQELGTEEGKATLKAEIMAAVGEIVPKPKIKNVYIVRLILQ